MRKKLIQLIFVILTANFVSDANATWSIIAVDRNTGEIGIAGASCTFDVQGIASIVPEKQQYGVLTLTKETKPLVLSDRLIADFNGLKIGDDFAVLGNILVGEDVINNAFSQYNVMRKKPLADRLMITLKAGEKSGGDKSCGSQYARSAFISVYDPKKEQSPNSLFMELRKVVSLR